MIELPLKIDRKIFINAIINGVDANIAPMIEKINEEYAYWDKVKCKAPDGTTPQQLWTLVKASRTKGKIIVWNKYSINLCLTNKMLHMCHDFDINWHRERTAMWSLKNREKWMNATHLPLGTVDDYIRDADGRVLLSIEELQKHKPDKHPDENANIYCFENAYVKNEYWGLMKIDEIKFEREYTKDEKTYSIDAGHFVRAILADALGGEKMVIM